MKTWSVIALLFLSVPLAAQASKKEILNAYVNSDIVQNTIDVIEREHRVSCDLGVATKSFPWFVKKVRYIAKCGSLKVKISAKYKNKRDPIFKITRLKVWDKGILLMNSSEEYFSLTSDPFLKAYKTSALVRDTRHFIENTYQVVCKEGRVRKGRVGGKANYFYFTKCKSDTQKIKLKLKSKVHIFGDRFKFDLTKYKLTF